MNKSWIVAVLLALVAIVPVFYIVYNNVASVPKEITAPQIEIPEQRGPAPKGIPTIEFLVPSKMVEPGAELVVKTCKVLDGYVFALFLENGQWIMASLPTATKPEAMQFVTERLSEQTASPPVVSLIRKVNNTWVVDLYLTAGDKRIRLRDVLKEKDLLL